MGFTDSPETKIVPNLSFSDYAHMSGISQSALKVFDYDLGGCPALYQWWKLHPDEQKDSKALSDGRRYHAFVLEPDTFSQFYALRTKEVEQELFEKAKLDPKCKARSFSVKLGTYEKWKTDRELEGKLVISQADFDVLQEMRRALMLNREVFDELGACRQDALELSAFAGFEFKRGPYHDGKRFQLKARFDIVPAGDALIDLKTARTAHPRRFARQAYELGYDLQAAFYLDCANANELKRKRFGFLAQDKFPPYLSCIHWVNGWLGHGRLRYTKILSDLADAITRDQWPGYCSGELEPPAFAMAEFEDAA